MMTGWRLLTATLPVAARSVPGLSEDGEVRHVADAGQGLAPEPMGGDVT